MLIEDLCTKHELPLRDYLAEDWTEDKTKDGESENGSSSLSKNSENKEKEREKGFTEEVGVKGSGRNTPIEVCGHPLFFFVLIFINQSLIIVIFYRNVLPALAWRSQVMRVETMVWSRS